MTQTENTQTSVDPAVTANNAVFSPESHRKALSLLERDGGNVVVAMLQPVRNVVAWLGIDIGVEKDWARVVAARTNVRKMFNNLPEAVNDPTIPEKKTGTDG